MNTNADCGMRNVESVAAGFSLRGNFVPRLSFLVFFLLIFLYSSTSCAELIDRVVAVVNNDVIALSELDQAVGFNKAMSGGNGDNLRTETLEGIINRRLLIQEARRLKFVEVPEQEVAAEIEKLKNRFNDGKAFNDFLAKLDLTEGQLGRMLGERLLVQRFIEKKIGLFIRISRDEALDFFNRNTDRFKGKSFAEVQKTITAGLQEQKLEQQIVQYLTELKSRADIRVTL